MKSKRKILFLSTWLLLTLKCLTEIEEKANQTPRIFLALFKSRSFVRAFGTCYVAGLLSFGAHSNVCILDKKGFNEEISISLVVFVCVCILCVCVCLFF